MGRNMKAPKWKRHRSPAEGDSPACVYETCDIGPFTIDVYESGFDGSETGCGYEIEDFGSSPVKSLEHAKLLAVHKALSLLAEWREQLLLLVEDVK